MEEKKGNESLPNIREISDRRTYVDPKLENTRLETINASVFLFRASPNGDFISQENTMENKGTGEGVSD